MSALYPLTVESYLSSVKLIVQFQGSKISEVGTGFIVEHNHHLFLCTARHVVDDSYRPRNKRKNADLKSVQIVAPVFKIKGGVADQKVTKVEVPVKEIFFAPDEHDAVAFKLNAKSIQFDDGYSIGVCAGKELITTDQWSDYRAGWPVYFVGYPSVAPTLDHTFGAKMEPISYPLLRQGVLATHPSFKFKVNGMLGTQYSYLDSYALGGFSGSPIYAPRNGWPKENDGNKIIYKGYTPQRLIGLLCGHLQSTQDGLDGKHSGLSYYLGADYIFNFINKIIEKT